MPKIKKNRFLLFIMVLMLSLSFSACSNSSSNTADKNEKSSLRNENDETYYMVTFLSGMEYWKGAYRGFQDAGSNYGIKTVYTGGLTYDINQQVTALEQVIAKKPSGIAITCINPNALMGPIQRAIAEGIPVVTFDADSPDSGRLTFLATNNEYAGSVAAKALNEQMSLEGGDVAIITLPTQQNHEQRVKGFKDALDTKYKKLKLVQIGNGRSDQTEAAKLTAAFIQAHPNIKGIFCTDATSGVGVAAAIKEAGKTGQIKVVSFDTDRGTLDAIRQGVISASIAQGTYVMGYQSMNFLYHINHDLKKDKGSLKNGVSNHLPSFIDTGVSIVTKENVDSFYEK